MASSIYYINAADNIENIKNKSRRVRRYNFPITLIEMEYLPDESAFDICVYDMDGKHEEYIDLTDTPISTYESSLLHTHDYFELTYTISGEYQMNIEGKNTHFSDGSILIMNRNTAHAELINTACKIFFLCLEPEFFQKYFDIFGQLFHSGSELEYFILNNLSENAINKKDYIFFENIRKNLSDKSQFLILQLLQAIKDAYASHRSSRQVTCFAMIAQIFELLDDQTCYQSNYVNLGNFPHLRTAEQIHRLIDNRNGMISRNEISEILHFTPSYIYHAFKGIYGIPPTEYCQQCRVRYMASLLTETEDSIDEIIRKCRMTNKTEAYRIFYKYYKTSPASYRKKYR